MKYLEIPEEVERQLIAIFDAALKQSGFQMQQIIQQVISKIQVKPQVEAVKEQP